MGSEGSESRSDGLDYEILSMMTEVEVEIVKNAFAKTVKEEDLTIVEEVLVREYEHRLKARELQRQAMRRNKSNGGAI